MANPFRRVKNAVTFRAARKLDRAAIARAHDAFYASDAWTRATWLGTQALKNPLDLWVYQEIVVETEPDVIVETGTWRGGSALYLATVCDLVGQGEVISIDVEPGGTTIRSTRGSRTSPGARRRMQACSRRSEAASAVGAR